MKQLDERMQRRSRCCFTGKRNVERYKGRNVKKTVKKKGGKEGEGGKEDNFSRNLSTLFSFLSYLLTSNLDHYKSSGRHICCELLVSPRRRIRSGYPIFRDLPRKVREGPG